MARADIRIRIRRRIIRIRITEARIRTIIRITAEQKPPKRHNLYIFFVTGRGSLPLPAWIVRLRSFGSRSSLCSFWPTARLRQKAKARADSRIRPRRRIIRRRSTEARIRTKIRTTAEQKPPE